MATLIERCAQLLSRPRAGLGELARAVAEGGMTDRELAPWRRPDPTRPYGRNVFLDADSLEGMIATWSREWPCLPHDHGGSVGVVRVLRGRCLHRAWRVEGGRLVPGPATLHEPGEVLTCGPAMIHNMADGGGDEPLVTLHLYRGPIPFMMVYDPGVPCTWKVAASCGAWAPDRPELELGRWDGILPRAEAP